MTEPYKDRRMGDTQAIMAAMEAKVIASESMIAIRGHIKDCHEDNIVAKHDRDKIQASIDKVDGRVTTVLLSIGGSVIVALGLLVIFLVRSKLGW